MRPLVNPLLRDDPTPFEDKRKLLVNSVPELQGTTATGPNPLGDEMEKVDPTVVGEPIEELIDGGNRQIP